MEMCLFQLPLSCYIVVRFLLDSAKSSLEAVMYREVSVDGTVRSLRRTLGNCNSIPYFGQQKTHVIVLIFIFVLFICLCIYLFGQSNMFRRIFIRISSL